jgi:nitronate monooxygenase
MISEVFALTKQPFNVNVFCHQPAQRDLDREKKWMDFLKPLFTEVGASAPSSLSEIYKSFLDDQETFEMLLELRPPILSFHFSIPSSDQLKAIREAGIYTLATATSLEEAKQIEGAGINAIVAQGFEAGGHRGLFNLYSKDELLSTSTLIRLLTKQSKLPIIAAGGIMDGQSIRAALNLGAVAAQLGTAFILCPESAASDHYRENLKSERSSRTQLTSVISGRPARGMVNGLITFGESPDSPIPPSYPVAYDAAKQLNTAAAKQNNHDFSAQWAGQGAPLARELPASELIKTLVQELNSL